MFIVFCFILFSQFVHLFFYIPFPASAVLVCNCICGICLLGCVEVLHLLMLQKA
ncbi:uncharacterized protein EV154DRAFT_512063 [Mucor mucedo]|uniref:uncharacterized protein n=1 Tax=Mucor mucedo TaxID=29922 RepID=UPI00221FC77F|nr:uncharacterized protein EV154DRAFT_512063 [Mucor mucedo]KAI7890280.1 hypothetical protein EV154DRAFT_512063 [Mucor mucedo]